MRAVIFDLDGTLVHSLPDIHVAAGRMLADLGRAPLGLDVVAGYVGRGVGHLVACCLAATGGAEARGLGLFQQHYAAVPSRLTRPYPGVVAALEALAAAGHPMGICTNKPEALARRILDDLDLARFFGAVVGGDSLPVMKPDPAPLRACLGALGGGPMLFVGDSETDAATAVAAAVPFALYTLGYAHGPVGDIAATHRFDDWAALPGLILY